MTMTLTEYYKQIYKRRKEAFKKLPKKEQEKKRLAWNEYMRNRVRNKKKK